MEKNMKNGTAETLKVVAYSIWILGGIGALTTMSQLTEIFEYTVFDFIPGTLFVTLAFNAFISGLTFFALSVIIELINDLKMRDVSLVKTNQEDEILTKF